ncbi:MAG: 50S ribosomal protein L30 [Deltaproteobacteria bacterium]|nr:50S ribosomal protein L30 [Deltaproteobacteria bacterium]
MPGIKVKLVSSRAARSKDQLATLKGLGLYKFGQERILPDNPSTLGMCEKLKHMVSWERVSEAPPASMTKARRSKKQEAQA